METKKFLTAKDLQQMLQLGRNKVYDLLQSGMIKSVKIGRSYRVEEKDLLGYLAANK